MNRRNVIGCGVVLTMIVAAISWLSLGHHFRQRQFSVAQQRVSDLGGSLSFDLVDGNYVLRLSGDVATDATIHSLLPTLRKLPTGFTYFGPGESRLFWVVLTDSSITKDGLNSLFTLHISWLSISTMRLSDESVSLLAETKGLNGIVLSNVEVTEAGMEQLRRARVGGAIMLNGEIVNEM